MNRLAPRQECRETDLLRSRLAWFFWWLPAAIFLAGVPLDTARTRLWSLSLVVAGSACVANASRCGRRHCYVTGPVFLLAPTAMLLAAAGVVTVDWRWIPAGVVAAIAAGYVLEWVLGKYAGISVERSRT